jgi:hypothetical protein
MEAKDRPRLWRSTSSITALSAVSSSRSKKSSGSISSAGPGAIARGMRGDTVFRAVGASARGIRFDGEGARLAAGLFVAHVNAVSEQELQRLVEADMRQRQRHPGIVCFEFRRAETHETVCAGDIVFLKD